MKAIAEALGRGLKVPVVSIKPEEAEAHFGWLARFAGHDMPASGAFTQQKLSWKPTGPLAFYSCHKSTNLKPVDGDANGTGR